MSNVGMIMLPLDDRDQAHEVLCAIENELQIRREDQMSEASVEPLEKVLSRLKRIIGA